jgi:hypothetical protein
MCLCQSSSYWLCSGIIDNGGRGGLAASLLPNRRSSPPRNFNEANMPTPPVHKPGNIARRFVSIANYVATASGRPGAFVVSVLVVAKPRSLLFAESRHRSSRVLDFARLTLQPPLARYSFEPPVRFEPYNGAAWHSRATEPLLSARAPNWQGRASRSFPAHWQRIQPNPRPCPDQQDDAQLAHQ